MSITYPLSLPSTPLPSSSKFTPAAAVAVSESPFTFEQQTYQHQGQRWLAEVTIPPMKRSKAAVWLATLVSLNGRQGTFLMGDWDGRTPQGSIPGSPQVNGASQTGNALNTKGWTSGKTGILLAGDYIQLGSGATARLYMVLANANSDGSGHSTLTIWPSLRTSPSDGDTITVTNTMSVFRLATPTWQWSADAVPVFGITFSAVEAL